ncbi:MAG: hypothetical protein KDK70_27775, partial [Myxococcales bacterium]|nr:hypothetical protein [Myxococcales bacterium]
EGRGGEDDASAAEPGPRIRWAILRVDGRPFEEVRDALAPRLPEVEILPFEDATFEAIGGELFAYVEVVVEPGPSAQTQLTVVLSDRRAYLRSFVPEPSGPLRSIATTVANTLVAIEQEDIEADEQAVDVPRPASEDTPAAPAEPEGASSEAAPASDEPATAAPREPAGSEDSEPAGAPPFELGIGLSGGPIFVLAPAAVRGAGAVGSELRVSARQRRGLLVELGLRVATTENSGYRLWRNRLQLAAGYGWRQGGFGVAAVIGPTVEPWAVRSDGQQESLVPVASARATPLWGAAAAITPAFHRQLTPTLRLRLGVRLDLATSVLASGAAGRVLVAAPEGTAPKAVLGLGGVELATSVEATLWIGPRPR